MFLELLLTKRSWSHVQLKYTVFYLFLFREINFFGRIELKKKHNESTLFPLFPVNEQKLIFKGKPLADYNRNLSEYVIVHESTMHLVARVHGTLR